MPVNEQYQIFFPKDVTYVNFHYLDLHTSYPIAGDTTYNGIDMKTARDISMHKNTHDATSYFACASKYDFFGGYDHGKQCGVVHIADHHIISRRVKKCLPGATTSSRRTGKTH